MLGGEGFDDAVAAARPHVESTGATFVHAFDDARVIAGQGTMGLELAEQLPAGPGTVVIPVGGGGLASGIAIGLRGLRPELSLVGVQAAACAPLAGHTPTGPTIADGIAVKHPAELTSEILRDLLDDVVVVDDAAISQAIVLLLERSKLVVEGAGAAPVAAVLGGQVSGDGFVCAVLAGGNIDATTLMSVTRFGLTSSGRYLVVRIVIPDRPGQLANIVAVIAAERANVLAVTHYREGRSIGVLETEAELTLETRGEEHSLNLVEALVDRRPHGASAALTFRRPGLARIEDLRRPSRTLPRMTVCFAVRAGEPRRGSVSVRRAGPPLETRPDVREERKVVTVRVRGHRRFHGSRRARRSRGRSGRPRSVPRASPP